MSIPVWNNRSQLKANYQNGLQNKKVWMILLLVNIFALPYAILTFFLSEEFNLLRLAVVAFSMGINMLLAIVIPFMQFDYHYDKTKVDMAYALPLTRKQKFMTDFMSGLSQYLVTYLVQVILSCIATAVVCTVGPRENWTHKYYMNRWIEAGDAWLWSNMFKILCIVLLIQICLYVVTCLVIACTGAMFEAISATICTNILMVTTLIVAYEFCSAQLFGMDFSEQLYTFLYRTSPLGGFIYLVSGKFIEQDFVFWILSYCVTILVLFVITYFIMTRRKAESVGKSFVIRPFYYIILFSLMLHIGVLVSFTDNSIISFVVATLLCYAIVELVSNRGVKKLYRSAVRYVIVISSVLIVIFTIQKTNCFGIAFRVSQAKDIDKIEVSYRGLFDEAYFTNLEIQSEDSIVKILDMQKSMIERYKEKRREANEGFFDLRISQNRYVIGDTYTEPFSMKVYKTDGEVYQRFYQIPLSLMKELVALELSDDYIDAKVEKYINSTSFLSVSDKYRMNDKTIVKIDENNRKQESSEVIQEFFECLRKDLKEVSIEEYLSPKQTTNYIVNTDEGKINILASYENCLAFLEQHNALPELTQADYKRVVEHSQASMIYVEDFSHGDADKNEIATGMCLYHIVSENDITRFDSNVQKLLEVAQVQYMSKKPCYFLSVYGEEYIIPVEYTELAETVMN